MKVERSTAVRSTATARRSGANNAAALQAPQQQQVVQNQSLTVPDLSGLNPTPPQFILPYQSGAGGQQIQQQTMQQPQQQILLPNMNEMPSQRLIRRGHQMELLAQAKVLCDHQDFVDLTIYCEDGVVRAHQMLLAVASPFLMMLFQSNPSYGNDDITLILPEVKACLVQALIHFVYTGVVVSNENHFYSLMKLVYALNINASIEAESTNDRATTFTAPLVPPAALGTVMRLSHQQPNTQQFSVQQGFIGQQSNLLPQPLLPQQPVPMSINGTTTTSNVNAVAAAAVAAITQPAIAPPNLVPPVSKAPRLSGPPANAMPVPIHNLTGTTTTNKLPIQLPTQPVPMVNGVVRGTESQHILGTAPPTQQYIAIDPTTGINYKVDMAMTNELGSADPLAAIMNETIFQDTSGAIVPAPNAQIYQTDSGQVIYTTQPPPNATGTIPTNIQIQQPQPLTSTPAQNKRGKKRGASKQDTSLNNNSPLANSTAPASILSLAAGESVDDLPCTPDDEDINTPYPCPSCNKTIKGKVMLQAHHYQEHYENTELNQMDVGDKHACRVCLKLFTRNSDVKAHILRVHCGDRRYPCTMCGKRFKESTHLRKHLYTHTGERPHFCSLCNKGFQTSSDLKRHKRTRVHQERVEQGGGIEPDDTPQEFVSPTSIAKKSAAVAPNGGAGGPATADLSTSGSRWPDEDDSNASGANSSNSTAQALLSGITEPVAITPDASDGQLIVPTTTTSAAIASVAGETSGESTTTFTTSGGGIVTTSEQPTPVSTAQGDNAAPPPPPLDLKELTGTSDVSSFISEEDNMAAAAAAAVAATDPPVSAAQPVAVPEVQPPQPPPSTGGNGISAAAAAPMMEGLDQGGAPDSGAKVSATEVSDILMGSATNEAVPMDTSSSEMPSIAMDTESGFDQQLAVTTSSSSPNNTSPATETAATTTSSNKLDSPTAANAAAAVGDEGEERLTVVEAPDESSQESASSSAPLLVNEASSSASSAANTQQQPSST